MRKQETCRVLHIVSAMDRGGAETMIMNVYRNIDRSKIQFDFIVHRTDKGDYDEEITEMGGCIYKILSLGSTGPVRYIKELVKIMKENSYIAVHSHTDYQSGFPTIAAKLAGIQNRICHSHSTNWQKGTSYKERVTLQILRSIIRFSATNYCSCSDEAAYFLFGKDLVNRRKVNILKNGIDIAQFLRKGENDRQSVIEELDFRENVKIIGHVGRFSDSKNHVFLLKVLKELSNQDRSFVAVLIGDGPLRNQIETEAEKLGIRDQVKLLGVRADISRLMNAFDVLLFPSKFEGFGIVTVEAQCSGTPCIISDTVPKTTDMGLGLTTYISLDDKIENWCTKINDVISNDRPDREMIIKEVEQCGFSIQNNVNDWVSLYRSSG